MDVQYQAFGERTTWSESASICHSRGAYLAQLDNMDKAKYIIANLAESSINAEDFWIGGRSVDGRWLWWESKATIPEQEDGSEFPPWVNWPTRSGKDCLAIDRDGHDTPQFLDLSCHQLKPFVCEKTWSFNDTLLKEAGRGYSTEPVSPVLSSQVRYRGSTYLVYSARSSWGESVGFCRARSQHLAIVPNNKLVNLLVQALNHSKPSLSNVWLGGERQQNGMWVWVPSGEPLLPTAPGSLFPPWRLQNGSEDANCLVISQEGNGTFVNSGCDTDHAFVCEEGPEDLELGPSLLTTCEGATLELDPRSKSWAKANRSCARRGARLLELRSRDCLGATLDLMAEHTLELRHVWAGGHISREGTHWLWVSTGEVIPFPSHTEPDGFPPWCESEIFPDRDCLNIDRESHSSAVVYGLECFSKQPFVCEYPSPVSAVTQPSRHKLRHKKYPPLKVPSCPVVGPSFEPSHLGEWECNDSPGDLDTHLCDLKCDDLDTVLLGGGQILCPVGSVADPKDPPMPGMPSCQPMKETVDLLVGGMLYEGAGGILFVLDKFGSVTPAHLNSMLLFIMRIVEIFPLSISRPAGILLLSLGEVIAEFGRTDTCQFLLDIAWLGGRRDLEHQPPEHTLAVQDITTLGSVVVLTGKESPNETAELPISAQQALDQLNRTILGISVGGRASKGLAKLADTLLSYKDFTSLDTLNLNLAEFKNATINCTLEAHKSSPDTTTTLFDLNISSALPPDIIDTTTQGIVTTVSVNATEMPRSTEDMVIETYVTCKEVRIQRPIKLPQVSTQTASTIIVEHTSSKTAGVSLRPTINTTSVIPVKVAENTSHSLSVVKNISVLSAVTKFPFSVNISLIPMQTSVTSPSTDGFIFEPTSVVQTQPTSSISKMAPGSIFSTTDVTVLKPNSVSISKFILSTVNASRYSGISTSVTNPIIYSALPATIPPFKLLNVSTVSPLFTPWITAINTTGVNIRASTSTTLTPFTAVSRGIQSTTIKIPATTSGIIKASSTIHSTEIVSVITSSTTASSTVTSAKTKTSVATYNTSVSTSTTTNTTKYPSTTTISTTKSYGGPKGVALQTASTTEQVTVSGQGQNSIAANLPWINSETALDLINSATTLIDTMFNSYNKAGKELRDVLTTAENNTLLLLKEFQKPERQVPDQLGNVAQNAIKIIALTRNRTVGALGMLSKVVFDTIRDSESSYQNYTVSKINNTSELALKMTEKVFWALNERMKQTVHLINIQDQSRHWGSGSIQSIPVDNGTLGILEQTIITETNVSNSISQVLKKVRALLPKSTVKLGRNDAMLLARNITQVAFSEIRQVFNRTVKELEKSRQRALAKLEQTKIKILNKTEPANAVESTRNITMEMLDVVRAANSSACDYVNAMDIAKDIIILGSKEVLEEIWKRTSQEEDVIKTAINVTSTTIPPSTTKKTSDNLPQRVKNQTSDLKDLTEIPLVPISSYRPVMESVRKLADNVFRKTRRGAVEILGLFEKTRHKSVEILEALGTMWDNRLGMMKHLMKGGSQVHLKRTLNITTTTLSTLKSMNEEINATAERVRSESREALDYSYAVTTDIMKRLDHAENITMDIVKILSETNSSSGYKYATKMSPITRDILEIMSAIWNNTNTSITRTTRSAMENVGRAKSLMLETESAIDQLLRDTKHKVENSGRTLGTIEQSKNFTLILLGKVDEIWKNAHKKMVESDMSSVVTLQKTNQIMSCTVDSLQDARNHTLVNAVTTNKENQVSVQYNKSMCDLNMLSNVTFSLKVHNRKNRTIGKIQQTITIPLPSTLKQDSSFHSRNRTQLTKQMINGSSVPGKPTISRKSNTDFQSSISVMEDDHSVSRTRDRQAGSSPDGSRLLKNVNKNAMKLLGVLDDEPHGLRYYQTHRKEEETSTDWTVLEYTQADPEVVTDSKMHDKVNGKK